MSDDIADRKKNVEELAREAGVYLSPERLSATEQRLKDEEQRKAVQAIEGVEVEHDQKSPDRGAPRPVGRPRGSRSVPAIGEKQIADPPTVRSEKPQNGVYMAGPRLRRLF
jgi:hypothetical protein